MNIIERLSPNKSLRGGHVAELVVIHGDAGRTDEGTVSWIESALSEVSYHYLIGREGDVYRFVPEELKAWHAGRSIWDGFSVAGSVNPVSIGVAFANDGTGGEEYRPVQYKVGGELVADICRRRAIPAHQIWAHYDVSPGRKTDPWDHFNWGEFYRWFGLYSGHKAA